LSIQCDEAEKHAIISAIKVGKHGAKAKVLGNMDVALAQEKPGSAPSNDRF